MDYMLKMDDVWIRSLFSKNIYKVKNDMGMLESSICLTFK